jgi:hypothetical protein
MQCPSCSAELKQRERSGYTCSKCKQPFALDPKQNPLRLHDLRLRALDHKLSDAGRLHYTTAQLLHVAAAPVVAAQQPFRGAPVGCMIATAILTLVGTTLIADNLLVGALIALGAVLILLATRLAAQNRPFYRKLPLNQADFERTILSRWKTVYGALPPGLLRAEIPPEAPLSPAKLRGALVCADAAVRECLAANGIPARLGLALLPAGPPFTPAEQAHLNALRTLPAAPLLLLHDASPAGCVQALTLCETLGFAAEQPVIDLGLRPRDVRPQQLVLGAPPDPGAIAQLRAAGALQPAELDWLVAGQVAPLAGVMPKRLIAIVEQGMQRVANTPEAQAQQVGFMSWP